MRVLRKKSLLQPRPGLCSSEQRIAEISAHIQLLLSALEAQAHAVDLAIGGVKDVAIVCVLVRLALLTLRMMVSPITGLPFCGRRCIRRTSSPASSDPATLDLAANTPLASVMRMTAFPLPVASSPFFQAPAGVWAVRRSPRANRLMQ